MTITLSKAETAILVEAASRPDGRIEISLATKPATRERMLGRLVRDGLTSRTEGEEVAHHLTPAGYRAVGLRPPRKPRTATTDAGTAASPRAGTKVALIRETLGRAEGATLDELIAATGWLPHTTRAALSRIKSAGDALTKSARPDGKTAYRIGDAEAEVADDAEPEPAPARSRGRRRPRVGAGEVGAVA